MKKVLIPTELDGVAAEILKNDGAYEVVQDYVSAGLRGNPPPHRVAQRQVESWVTQGAESRVVSVLPPGGDRGAGGSQRPVGAPIIPSRASQPRPPSPLLPPPRSFRDGE